MAILELQDMEVEFGPEENGGSHGSKGCGNDVSTLSLLLC